MPVTMATREETLDVARDTEFPTMAEDEFVEWCNKDTRAEFTDGRIVFMSPVSIDHSLTFNWLTRVLGLFVEHRGLGVVLGSEVMLRLRPGLRRLPDLIFVAEERRGILRQNHIEGAPDAVFEIVSPDSVSRDWREKFAEYAEAGVSEYWVIDSPHQRADLNVLDEGGRYESVEEDDGYLISQAIEGFRLKTEWLWEEPLPNPLDVLRELGVP
ncbi:MAG: hypothetical protein AUJ92_14660 [Armatimonadetes bacterium CG2_30_59_28]|nr:Uma2 family endonuclease [Armatimonadota bacterium]OIO92301.1 MAG: hypothetical protein AUJ92_14660 [Armatimonadetes bacterium CG2_30_59_28]PIU65296.1 MAG: hypothetical protein COS85_09250 [Armatimonadetes bacterium CG07_land_8_20_14_0_80_59_28]PIX42680.1 MAG: hypothetical protein COZ56_08750 [Armatimonadetes bacterium CG_4_8_14_3_um_filter_58_9]PIY41495.1 MAG: hypothetical protein COZ05_15645 [Armatimonadetes bacterium CG_4_10_14_3_um_filter_59_10]PJB68799.1 MAG: hypothetical protein CO095